ncbi:MAG: multidrug efflux SMR transporter [Bacteroidetes bacterium]|nr:multidrug efflux SMR transporter [Bacteroidota bacterium]
MAWIYLLIAGLLEIAWAIGLKVSHGFTRPLSATVTILLMLASFWFLSKAVQMIPIGTAYAVWTGIGAAGTAIAGMILFQEPTTWIRLVCIVLIVAGIVGLKISV